MKKILTFVMAIALCLVADAQIVSSTSHKVKAETTTIPAKAYSNYNRLTFGYSANKLTTTDGHISASLFDSRSKGFEMGYIRGISLTSKMPLYLEVGGKLTFNHWKETDSDYEDRYNREEETNKLNLLSLSVPVNVAYKYTFANNLWIEPFAGMHLRFNVIGKLKETCTEWDDGDKDEYTEKYSIFDKEEFEDTAKRVQFGGQLGVNVGYKALNLGVSYIMDSPLYKDDSEKIKESGVVVNLGFNF